MKNQGLPHTLSITILFFIPFLWLMVLKVDAQQLRGDFWIDNKITFSNLIEPDRRLSILLSGGTAWKDDGGDLRGGVPESGTVTVTLPEHVTFEDIRVDTAFGFLGVEGREGTDYDLNVSDRNVTLTMYGKDGKPDTSAFEAWLSVKTAGFDELPQTAPKWDMPLSLTATLKDGQSVSTTVTETGAWLYSRVTTELLDPMAEVQPGDILRYRVSAAGYPHGSLTRTSILLGEPRGTDVIPGSVEGVDGGELAAHSFSYTFDGGRRGGIIASFSVEVRDRFNLERAEIEAIVAQARVTHVVEADYIGNPVHVRSDSSKAVSIPVFLPREAKVNIWFFCFDESYTVGKPGNVCLNFFLDDDAPITVHLREPLTSSDDEILRSGEVILPESFTLTPEDPRRLFTIPLDLLGGGLAEIGASATATESDGAVLPLRATAEITVEESAGDLLLNRSLRGENAWFGDDLYQAFPAGDQRLTVAIPPEGEVTVALAVENDADEERSFLVRASETLGEWNSRFRMGSRDAPGEDVSEAMASDGWNLTLPGKSTQPFIFTTRPAADSFGSQKSVVFLLLDPDDPERTLDAVEIVVDRSPIRVEVEPEFPLVGHKAKVIISFQNTSDEPMRNVRPLVLADKPDIFDRGASVQRLSEAPEPASVEVLAAGRTATFVYEYRVLEEGQIRFDARVGAQLPDGSAFESSLGQSPAAHVGKLSVEEFELVQALPDVPLIKGKYGAVSARIANSSPVLQTLSWELSVTSGGAFKRWLADTGEEAFPPMHSQRFLLPIEGQAYLPIENGGLWKFTLFGDDVDVADYEGRVDEAEITLTQTYPLETLFVVLEYPEDLVRANVTAETAAAIQRNHGKLINAMLPMPYTPIPPVATVTIQPPPGYLRFRHWRWVVSEIAQAAHFDSYDRVVVVFPDDLRYWPEARAIGMANPGPGMKYAPTILGTADVANKFPETATHEIVHSFGIQHSADEAVVPLAFEVGPEGASILTEAEDLMRPASLESWINESHYQLMVGELSEPLPDPEAVVIGGSVTASGEVEAGPWNTVWTDQITPLSAEGTHAVVMKNHQGETVLRHHFTPVYRVEARLLPGDDGPSTFPTEEGPFVFSLPRPRDLSMIQILEGEALLYERPVSVHAPVIETMSPLEQLELVPGNRLNIEWTASDADGDTLSASLSWSANGGGKWVPISFQMDAVTFPWTVPDISTADGWIRLRVTDGINTALRDAGPFRISGSAATLQVNPGSNLVVPLGVRTVLDGSKTHATDGAALFFAWKAIVIPDGASVTLSEPASATPAWTPDIPGDYLFKLEVTDASAREGLAYKLITVSESVSALRKNPIQIRQLEDGRIEVRWPASAGDQMETSFSLTPSAWSLPLQTTERNGDDMILTLTQEQLSQFFRLRLNP